MGLKLSISNIAWSPEYDQKVYEYLNKKGFTGLEIAPTRIFPDRPYERISDAVKFTTELHSKYGLETCSIQSIWYGRSEKIFGTDEERNVLLDYTKKAIDFAEAMGTKNLVFGCPKNRCIENEEYASIAVDFFRTLGDYAEAHETVLALEANPVSYGTNFINKTYDAIELIQKVDSKGFKLNLDFGTIIFNKENIMDLISHVNLINHVHISEPNLKLIEHRKEHQELINLLKKHKYNAFISIEMKRCEDIYDVLKTIDYIAAL